VDCFRERTDGCSSAASCKAACRILKPEVPFVAVFSPLRYSTPCCYACVPLCFALAPSPSTRPELLLGVGLGGLAINLFGMCLFSGHGHSHAGGHGHSHGGGGKKDVVDVVTDEHADEHTADPLAASNGSARSTEMETALAMGSMNPIPTMVKKRKVEAGSMNMHGVFLHLLGDFLGSIAVVVTAVVVWQSEWKGRHYLDPVLSLVIVIIIVVATVPLVKQSALVLMQTTPSSVDLVGLRKGVEKIKGVLGMHELHVWSLVGDKLIASAHVTFKDAASYVKVAARIKAFFHVNGIHSITIQPEFIGKNTDGFSTTDCLLPCGDDSCEPDACCPEDSEDKLSTLHLRRSFQMPASVRRGRTSSRTPSPSNSDGVRGLSASPHRATRTSSSPRPMGQMLQTSVV
jgi:cation diffusion facilitator family transporter